MFQSVRARSSARAEPEIRIAPLIDMVFILLIFFIVTTTFIRETGIEVEKPDARTATDLDKNSFLVGIGPTGDIYVEEKRVSLLSLRPLVERQLQRKPNLSVVLVSDKATPAGSLVQVMDEVRLAGARRIAIASRREK